MYTHEASALLRSITGKASIKGVNVDHLCNALQFCNIDTSLMYHFKNRKRAKTLNNIYKELFSNQEKGTFLIVAGQHYIVLHDGMFIDGIVKKLVTFDHELIKRKSKVEYAWMLSTSNVTIPKTLIENAKDHRKASRMKAIKKAKDYCNTFNMECDPIGNGVIMVYPPSRFIDGPQDPFTDQHYVDSWEEVVERLEFYIEELRL